MESKNFLVEEEYKNLRLDIFLCEKIKDKSRSSIQKLIEKGLVEVNNKIKKSNYKLKEKDRITIIIEKETKLNIISEDIPIDIIYEDKDILVVNKPQGMVVHPGAGNYKGTLVNALLNHCDTLSNINDITRPGIVHRIDKDTSGVLVVAKNNFAHIKLAEQLKNHSMNRIYIALVEGNIKEEKGIIDASLGRHPIHRKKITILKGGRRAVTHYEVLKRYKSYTLIQCILETGRTHQIRVHMASKGHPLVGDPVYGFKKQKFNLKGQLLHAKKLGFIHPSTEKYMEFQSQIPSHFTKILHILENKLQ